MNWPHLNAISDKRTTHNPHYIKIAQTAQNKRANGNAIIAMVAARHDLIDFFVKSLLHFCKYLINPNFRNPVNRCFQWWQLLSIRKYCQLFSGVEYKTTLKNATQTIGDEKRLIPPLSLRGCGLPSNTPVPWPTPLTIPNSIQSVILP